jgi:hypothetical protein
MFRWYLIGNGRLESGQQTCGRKQAQDDLCCYVAILL